MKPRRLQRLTRVSKTSGGIALAKCVGRPVLLPQFRYMIANLQRVHRFLGQPWVKNLSRINTDEQPDFDGKSAHQVIRRIRV